LVENPEAVSSIADRYRAFYESGAVDSPELTSERKKMGILPRGAEMLPNPVGAAPAVWLDTSQGIISCLPGVPRELKTIFEEHLQDRIRALAGSQYRAERNVLTPLGDESVLGGITEKAMKQVPGVYMKTLPKTFGPEVRLSVRIEAAGENSKAVNERVRTAETALLEEVRTWQEESRQ
jgi:molybdopterin-biosynthesis enzyme MoeA-like protein